MPALASNILLLFVLLAPGFVFIISFYGASRMSHADMQHGVVFDTALLILLSVVSHTLVGVIYFSFLSCFSVDLGFRLATEIIHYPAAGANGSTSMLEKADFYLILLYLALLLALSWGAGTAFIKLMDRGRFPSVRNLYGTYADLVWGKTDPILVASVMTKTMYQNRILMYEGFVDEISFGAMRKINYVSLYSANRFYAKMKDDHIDVADARAAMSVSEDSDYRLIIPGDQIQNVLFRRVDEEPASNCSPNGQGTAVTT